MEDEKYQKALKALNKALLDTHESLHNLAAAWALLKSKEDQFKFVADTLDRFFEIDRTENT